MINRALVTLFATLALGATACAPIEEIDRTVDCNDVCNRYADCFDSGYDRASCRDRCADVVDNDPRAANDCDTCLDGRACSESFPCTDECFGIVP